MQVKKFLIPSLPADNVSAPEMNQQASIGPTSLQSVANRTSYDAIDTFVEQQRHRLRVPGVSLAVVEGDEIVHLRGFGQARPGSERPTPQTPFYIGSLTKSFTALAVMQLVETGKLDLDAPVQRYLPWFLVADPQASAQMTVRHLLNQTSGLPTSSGEFVLADFDDCLDAAERQARTLSTLVLTRPVGSAWEYSNSNYQLLGLLVEAASGERYADYVQNHILIPLGMCHTHTSSAMAKQDGAAVGHQYWFAMPFAAPNMPMPSGALAGGGLASSAEDMAHWLIAHLNGGRYQDSQVLSSAGIDALHQAAVSFRVYGLSMQYGMGWFVDKIGQNNVVWHSGTLPHFGAFMALLPEQKKGVVLLFNACHHWFNPIFIGVGLSITALLAGERPAPAPMVSLMPWILRAQLLIPALQVVGGMSTLKMLNRPWRNLDREPSRRWMWGQHLLLPLLPNLLAALTVRPLLTKRHRYLRLYMPDYSWIAMICGSFSLVWSVLRTGLLFRAMTKSSSSQSFVGHRSAHRSLERST